MPKVINSDNCISQAFKDRLMDLMEEKEVPNLNTLSQQAKVSKALLSRTNKYCIVPSLRSLIKLADYFDVSLFYLLGRTNENDFMKSENPTTFHERLEELRSSQNLKYSQIAHSMPFTKNHFYDWQREKTLPCLDYLEALATYFKVTPDYLLGRTDYKN